jgi:hypothetical protein
MRIQTLCWIAVVFLFQLHATLGKPCHSVVDLLVWLMMPPSARWSLGQQDGLQKDCWQATEPDIAFSWENELDQCDYRLATRIFDILATGETTTLWLPRLNQAKSLDPLVRVLNKNAELLGGMQATTSAWPKTPATRIQISFQMETTSSEERSPSENDAPYITAAAIQSTEKWVENKLCKMKLCPFTFSLKRAAVGLDVMGVQEGPIVIRYSGDDDTSSTMTIPPAILLARAVWHGVTELAETPESKVATLLIVAPPLYDSKFLEFSAVFDSLLEPSIQATVAEAIVGRAIFHPHYNSEQIGHTTILPGHALPAKMVEGFMNKYVQDNAEKLDLASIARANDAVRWTPHATINLLRRSQLTAAKQAEATSANKKPNWIYARNVLQILKSGILSSKR